MASHSPMYDHHHAVQFYGDDESLFTTVSAFLSQGFVDGHAGIVIGIPSHKSRNLIVLDAQETLDRFMTHGMPDQHRFDESVGKLIAEVLDGREDKILIRAYGEMVDVLWKQGKPDAAIRLEMLWNRLAQQYGFALLCGYSMGNFYKETKGLEAVCRQHTHIVAPLAAAARAHSAG